MKLDRASEILEKEEEDTWLGSEKEWKAAVKIGYEAIKGIKAVRQLHPELSPFPLPGETEE